MSDLQILLLGPPGAGKGTQSSRIAEAYDLEHITTGDALRSRKDMQTAHGTPREYMDAGELVPDPVVNEIVESAIEEADGFVLDGYPRNKAQAEFLDEITDLDVVIYLDVDREELIRRLTGRRVCEDCGENYHVEFAPPVDQGICDDCGGELIQRTDDSEKTVKERLRVFDETTKPVITYYRSDSIFHQIDGNTTPDIVFKHIVDLLDSIR